MAQLRREDVVKLAQLAKLSISDDEIDRYREEISALLEFVEQLQSIDVDGVEPTSQVSGNVNKMRPDTIKPPLASKDKLLANLPDRQDDYIRVKRMR
jgi:aspartyl-tRNA(Asn)/glutamyl-tRNA(Gln) amidotransferase subunit C